MDDYLKFLDKKRKKADKTGFSISESDLNPKLKDFQKFIVKKAIEHGKYALFADTGLGKTFMQIEWAYHVSRHTNKPVLILAPLAVVTQTIREGIKWGYTVNKLESIPSDNGIYITNYDQLENINTRKFSGIVLDESSILKNESGKKRQLIIDNYASSTRPKNVNWNTAYFDNSASRYGSVNTTSVFNSTTAITSIDIVRLTGGATFTNQNSSSIRLYGVS
jgi:superfamily II DNA or RNA helicase